MMNTQIAPILPALLATAPFTAREAQADQKPIRVLILSGQTVHDCKTTTPFIEKMYNRSGRFQVVGIVEDVSRITADTFSKCDVIVSNWTCHPIMTGGPWTAEGKEAFSAAIRAGKGMVSFHAASAACNDWEDFQTISGLTWKLNHTSHTTYHTFKVVIRDQSHPITRGLPDFWITDELYQKMVKMTEAEHHLLAEAWSEGQFNGTARYEPMLITTQLGQGRGVNLLLGHDVPAMSNPAFQTLMLRSTEWAATGEVTIPMADDWPFSAAAASVVGVDVDAAVKAAAGYAHGQSRRPLFVLEQLTITMASLQGVSANARRHELATKLAAALESPAAPEAKAFLCGQLSQVGTAEQVPAIAALLEDVNLSDAARLALERIPAPEAGQALIDALEKTTGQTRQGIVASLANRGAAEAVAVLTPLLKSSDATLVNATAAALGRIGGEDAVAALQAALPGASAANQPALLDAFLACAEKFLADGRKLEALKIYRRLYSPALPLPIRLASLRGLMTVRPGDADRLLLKALTSSERSLQVLAISLIRKLPAEADLDVFAGRADRLPPESQILLARALADRKDKAALAVLREAIKTADPSLQRQVEQICREADGK